MREVEASYRFGLVGAMDAWTELFMSVCERYAEYVEGGE